MFPARPWRWRKRPDGFINRREETAAQGNLRTWNQLPRSEGYRKVLDWKEHEGWNEKE